MDSQLPVECYELPDWLAKRSILAPFENEETRAFKIEELRRLLQEDAQLRLPKDDVFLLQFLRARKYDVERSSILCRNFFKKQKDLKDFFSSANFDAMQRLCDSNCVGCLPRRDVDGSVVLIFFAGRWDPKIVSIKELAQFFIFSLIFLVRFPASQIAGCKCIMDFEGLSLKHLTSVSARWVWHTLDSMQNCIPFSYKAFYIVNENRFFPYIWSILKLFLSKKLASRFHFLGKNVDKLHQVFPPSTLPKEFGGDLGPHSSETFVNIVKSLPLYLQFLHNYGYKANS